MDIDAALQAHLNWTSILMGHASGASFERIDPVTAGKDDHCELGQWLHHAGKAELAGRLEYLELLRAHADFHRQAGALLRLTNEGQGERVRALLQDPFSAFRLCSAKVVGLLQTLSASPGRA